MRQPRAPLFLARRAYRQRRLADAARLLPLVGAFLFLVPVFWQPAATPVPDTAPGGLYIFAVWALLILAAGLIALRLGPDEAPPGDEDGGGP
jgi:hypothetical protein